MKVPDISVQAHTILPFIPLHFFAINIEYHFRNLKNMCDHKFLRRNCRAMVPGIPHRWQV